RHVLDVHEADHHIGDLHAGVVYVVVNFDLRAGRTQGADEGVAEHGVAQVADVRGLVRIDVRVLDDGLQPCGRRRRRCYCARARANSVVALSVSTQFASFTQSHAWPNASSLRKSQKYSARTYRRLTTHVADSRRAQRLSTLLDTAAARSVTIASAREDASKYPNRRAGRGARTSAERAPRLRVDRRGRLG